MTDSPSYRILKYPWHTAHDYELTKLPHQFLFLCDSHREWATQQRPVPANVQWVPSLSDTESDCMILHVDQWVMQEPAKRMLYLRCRDRYDGPKVVINHGSNLVDGCSSEEMQDLIGDAWMVTNSPLAKELWGVERSSYIRHGMTPEEWPQTTYARREVLVVQAYGKIHQTCRNVDLVERAEKVVPLTWVGRDRRFATFNQYRHFLANGSIFFQPSFASANPRSRTEAMLCGLAVVTTAKHGEDEYIENYVNGFASNDQGELIEALAWLHEHPDEARRIGQAGRETAQRHFHVDQFISQWENVLSRVVGSES